MATPEEMAMERWAKAVEAQPYPLENPVEVVYTEGTLNDMLLKAFNLPKEA